MSKSRAWFSLHIGPTTLMSSVKRCLPRYASVLMGSGKSLGKGPIRWKASHFTFQQADTLWARHHVGDLGLTNRLPSWSSASTTNIKWAARWRSQCSQMSVTHSTTPYFWSQHIWGINSWLLVIAKLQPFSLAKWKANSIKEAKLNRREPFPTTTCSPNAT